MYELKKSGKVFTSKYVGTGPSSYEKRIYRAAVSQRLRNCSKTYLLALRDARSNRASLYFFSDFILKRSYAFSKDLLEGCKFRKYLSMHHC